jgi:mono/diheme cytochrome c family protein
MFKNYRYRWGARIGGGLPLIRPNARRMRDDCSQAGYASSYALVLGTGIVGALLWGAHGTLGPVHAQPTPPAPARVLDVTPLGVDQQAVPEVHQQAIDVQAVLNEYCVACHNEALGTANLAFDTLDASLPGTHPATWEKVVTKLRTRTMPPIGRRRPDPETYAAVAGQLETQLDAAWAANPYPGRINAIHRLNRTEYNNAIRDLLVLDFDVRDLLPGDETADGSFDNIAASLTISTAHLERYVSVARQVSRLATGLPPVGADFKIFRVDELMKQTDLMDEDLSLGSRGGMAIRYHFPADGEYLIKVNLTANYADYLKGMGWPQEIEFRLDGGLMGRFTSGGAAGPYRPAPGSYEGAGTPGFEGDWEWEAYMQGAADDHLQIRTFVSGGPHVVGVAFPMYMWEQENLLPQPPLREWGKTLKDDARYMDYQGVNDLMIEGPYQISESAGDTPSRREIFVCVPEAEADERECAARIVERMARRAYRRPVTGQDVQKLMEFFDRGRQDGQSFDAGIQFAIERILVDPAFLLRVYRDPDGDPERARAGSDSYRLSDLEVASRLSFFVWSSIPDESLLDLAEQGRLTDPAVLRQQVRRMLADPRAADALTKGFASQWLNLRVLADKTADEDLFPLFDNNLLEAMRLETEMFVASTITEDRSLLDLLSADYTFLNERLARHYGISDVYGSRMRRVVLPNLEERGGLLGQSALLALTSYPNRTSPVLRGKWLLDNIMGTPVPAPPAGVNTDIEDGRFSPEATIRERMESHRTDPVCATCHSVMDPLGFALESFDAVGAWRSRDGKGNPVDDSGASASGAPVDGFAGLRALLLDQGDQFANTVTAKLMVYALGRRLEYYDLPAVRKIVSDAEPDDYRWSSLVAGIVESPGFLMRARSDTVGGQPVQ